MFQEFFIYLRHIILKFHFKTFHKRNKVQSEFPEWTNDGQNLNDILQRKLQDVVLMYFTYYYDDRSSIPMETYDCLQYEITKRLDNSLVESHYIFFMWTD